MICSEKTSAIMMIALVLIYLIDCQNKEESQSVNQSILVNQSRINFGSQSNKLKQELSSLLQKFFPNKSFHIIFG